MSRVREFLFDLHLDLRVHAYKRLSGGCAYLEFVTYRYLANVLEDLASRRFPTFDKED